MNSLLVEKHDILRHISHQFDEDLLDIHRDVLAMGHTVAAQVAVGMETLFETDASCGERLIPDNRMVESIEVLVDEACVHVLARRQPTARDLRLVRAMNKAIIDLDFMANEASLFVTRARELLGQSPAKNQLTDLAHLAACVHAMLLDVLHGLAAMDLERAIGALRADRGIRGQYESILRQQITYMMEAPHATPLCLNVLCSAHSLACIGKGSDNICRHVIYYATGKDIRHMPKGEMQKVLSSETDLLERQDSVAAPARAWVRQRSDFFDDAAMSCALSDEL